MKHFTISVDVFDVDVSVLIDFSEADIRRHFRKDKEAADICRATGGWDSSRLNGAVCRLSSPIVLLRSKGQPIHEMAALVTHEMLHVSFHILRSRSVTPSVETEEIYCYLTDYLVGETFRRMRGGR